MRRKIYDTQLFALCKERNKRYNFSQQLLRIVKNFLLDIILLLYIFLMIYSVMKMLKSYAHRL